MFRHEADDAPIAQDRGAEPQAATLSRLLRDAEALLGSDRHAAARLLAEAARPSAMRGDVPGDRVGVPGGLAPWQALRAARYVEENLAERILLRDIAAEVRLGVRHFARAFRLSFGCTAHGYLMERRLANAQDMMLKTEAPLSEIALACGLSDQAHLTRLFRRHAGVTPLTWRRLHRTG